MEDKIEIRTSWCAEDVRNHLGDAVKHMTDDEIFEELGNCYKSFEETYILSGWDVIEFCFEIKGKEANEE